MKTIKCTQCGGEMFDTAKGGQSVIGFIGILILALFVIATFFFFWPLSLLIVIVSLFLPKDVKKHFKTCDGCGFFFEVMK